MKRRILFDLLTGFLIITAGISTYLSLDTAPVFAQQDFLDQNSHQPQNAEEALKTAKKWVKNGDYSEALSVLEPYISQPEKYPDIYSDYIVILSWSGDSRRSISLFESMPSSVPRRAYLLRNIAKAYYDLSKFSKAISLYSEVLELTPKDRMAREGLVLCLFATGDTERAIEILEQMPLKTSDDVNFHLKSAELLFNEGLYWDSLNTYQRVIAESKTHSKQAARIRDNQLSVLKKDKQTLALNQVSEAISLNEENAAQVYVLLLILFRDFKKGVETFESYGLTYRDLTHDQAYWVAWAFFKTGDPTMANAMFKRILIDDPSHIQSKIGQTYCMTVMGNSDEGLEQLRTLESRQPDNLEVLYAIAFVHEKSGRFLKAVEVYDRILKISPGNVLAKRLQLRAYSDMGAATYAADLAEKELPSDDGLRNSFLANSAVHHIRWDEPEIAKDILSPLTQTQKNQRYRYDYIAVLNRGNYQQKAIEQYEILVNEGDEPPQWVLVEVAEAYLHVDKHEKALELFNRVLEINKNSRKAKIGKFNTLQGLLKWEEAQAILDDLDNETPKIIGKGKYAKFNPEKEDLAVRRGWFLANQGRLKEADAYLQEIYTNAPANLEIRDALAHVHLWRGWPRKALNEFNIIRSMDPEYMSSETGRIETMNVLAYKNEARKQADELVAKKPREKWPQRLVRRFEVEDMHENQFGASFSYEDDGITDIKFYDILSTSINPRTRVYGLLSWRKTWDDKPDADDIAAGDQEPTYYRRIGAGIINIFNSDWTLIQQLSADYNNGEDLGLLTSVIWTPNDHWEFGGLVDTFTTDVAKRAWAKGVTAKQIAFNGKYRQSEWWEYNFSLSRQQFSDDNDRDELLMDYQRNIYLKNNWRMRLFLGLYAAQNSEWDNPDINYFNPKNAWGLSVTHMTEQTVWKIYNHYFIHRLYLTAGNYKQYSYSNGLIGSFRYEQDFEFSDTHHLRWGANVGTNLYDGEYIDNIGLDLLWILRF